MEAPPPPRIDQWITMILEVVLYCIHLSVIVVMISRRKIVFNSAFYYILLTICIADLLYFLFVSLFAIRFVSFGFFVNFYLDNVWIASAGFTLSNVFGYGQFVWQTLISINRFTVFWLPAKHEEIWKGTWYLIILNGLPLLVIPTRIPDGGQIVFSKSGAAVTYASEAMEYRALYMTTTVYIVNGTITAVLSILTAFSIIIFCIQMLRVIYAVLRNLFLPYPSIIAFLMYLLLFISDFHAWVCSISLICMSQASRKAFVEFYFGNATIRTQKIFFLSTFTTHATTPQQGI